MCSKTYIAVDIGASNGRLIVGRFDGKRLAIDELHRFENAYVKVNGAYYWDVLYLFVQITEGLKTFAQKYQQPLDGIGIDTWGVDFGLIDKKGELLGNPRAYRDPRGMRGMQAFYQKAGERFAFNINGIANMPFNTLYQLFDMVLENDPRLKIADRLLMMPDLIAYMLCGRKSCEYSEATTTQMLDQNGNWSSEIVRRAGIDFALLPQIQKCGEKKADLYPHIAEETGLALAVPVYCVGSHDTASAVASIPEHPGDSAFLSSGTWSLIGVEREQALIRDDVFDLRFSNEGSAANRVQLLRNIMGMWIIQNCKRAWDKEKKHSWDDVVEMARQAPAFRSYIDVEDHVFYDGGNMIEKIQQYCRRTLQPIPQTKGEIARVVYESLALCYREAFAGLEELIDARISKLYIIGGGANNRMLNGLAAGAIGRPVTAGLTEATAVGNLIVQMKASGALKNADEMRQVVRDSFVLETYEPKNTSVWTEQYERYQKLKARNKD